MLLHTKRIIITSSIRDQHELHDQEHNNARSSFPRIPRARVDDRSALDLIVIEIVM
jgi:hypothetical protein